MTEKSPALHHHREASHRHQESHADTHDNDLRNEWETQNFLMRANVKEDTIKEAVLELEKLRKWNILTGMQLEPDLVLLYTKERNPRLILIQKNTGNILNAESFVDMKAQLNGWYVNEKTDIVRNTKNTLNGIGTQADGALDKTIANITTVMDMVGGKNLRETEVKFYHAQPKTEIKLKRDNETEPTTFLNEEILRDMNRQIAESMKHDTKIMDAMAEQESGYETMADGKSFGIAQLTSPAVENIRKYADRYLPLFANISNDTVENTSVETKPLLMRLKVIAQEYVKTNDLLNAEENNTKIPTRTKNKWESDVNALKQAYQATVYQMATEHIFDASVNLLLWNAYAHFSPETPNEKDRTGLANASRNQNIKNAIIHTLHQSDYDLPKGKNITACVNETLAKMDSPEAQATLAKMVYYNGNNAPLDGFPFKYYYALCILCRVDIKRQTENKASV